MSADTVAVAAAWSAVATAPSTAAPAWMLASAAARATSAAARASSAACSAVAAWTALAPSATAASCAAASAVPDPPPESSPTTTVSAKGIPRGDLQHAVLKQRPDDEPAEHQRHQDDAPVLGAGLQARHPFLEARVMIRAHTAKDTLCVRDAYTGAACVSPQAASASSGAVVRYMCPVRLFT